MITFQKSRRSDKDYFAWRKLRAQKAVAVVEKYQKLSGARVLDIGCGYGSLSAVLSSKKARVLGIEKDIKSLKLAKQFVRDKHVSLKKGDAQKLPFKDGQFEIVFLFDVIEHVQNPTMVVKEAIRVLKSKGFLYIEFTPYYSLIGHHLYDVTLFPIQLLPKKWIKWLVYKNSSTLEVSDDRWQTFESLNKLRISDLQRNLKTLILKEERFILKHPRFFEINLPFLNLLGWFKDTLSFSYIGLWQKN